MQRRERLSSGPGMVLFFLVEVARGEEVVCLLFVVVALHTPSPMDGGPVCPGQVGSGLSLG